MAKFNTTGFEDVEKQFLRASEIATKAVPLMLEAGADVLVEAYKEEIQKSYGVSKRSKGDLKRSIRKTVVKNNGTSAHIEVYPHGKDSKGVDNATKGFVLEYGRGQGSLAKRLLKKKGKATARIAPQRWMERSNAKSEDEVHEKMEKVWEGMGDGS